MPVSRIEILGVVRVCSTPGTVWPSCCSSAFSRVPGATESSGQVRSTVAAPSSPGVKVTGSSRVPSGSTGATVYSSPGISPV